MMDMLLQREMSRVCRRLQCCTSRNKDLRGHKKRSRIQDFKRTSGGYGYSRRGAARHSPVGDVITTGEVEVLQPVQVRCSLCHSAVTDARAVAERQAGEAAAVPRHRRQAGVGDARQHGKRQTAKVRVAHHLQR